MNENRVPDLGKYLVDWAVYLEALRQHYLLDEKDFIELARNLRIPVEGLFTGTPGDFVRRGWLNQDGVGFQGNPSFHPFRILPMASALNKCRMTLGPEFVLHSEKFDEYVEIIQRSLPNAEDMEAISSRAVLNNRIVELAILLEPLYWPRIVSSISRPFGITDEQRSRISAEYRNLVADLLKNLDASTWQEIHDNLRTHAAQIDRNDELYLLLRLSKRDIRAKLQGSIGHSLLIRQIAEVIRRGFEDVHNVNWPEEDVTFASWPEGTRTTWYGSERPLDNELASVPYLAKHFGFLTGSALRWYVEGKTEYFAIKHILPNPELLQIELVNLEGVFKGKNAHKFETWLEEDMNLQRFSMISFDMDVQENVKVMKIQVGLDHVIGFIAANKPDFEFNNFTLSELKEVAARLDEDKNIHGGPVSGNSIRNGDFVGVNCGSDFEKRYVELSDRGPRDLKGAEWGQALAIYATEFRDREDTNELRPFWREIQAACSARVAHYDYQKANMKFNLDTFELEKRSKVPSNT